MSLSSQVIQSSSPRFFVNWAPDLHRFCEGYKLLCIWKIVVRSVRVAWPIHWETTSVLCCPCEEHFAAERHVSAVTDRFQETSEDPSPNLFFSQNPAQW